MCFNTQSSLNIALFLCGSMENLVVELESSCQSAFLCLWQDSTLTQCGGKEKKVLKRSYQAFAVKGRLDIKKTWGFNHNFLNQIQRFQDYLGLFWMFWWVKKISFMTSISTNKMIILLAQSDYSYPDSLYRGIKLCNYKYIYTYKYIIMVIGPWVRLPASWCLYSLGWVTRESSDSCNDDDLEQSLWLRRGFHLSYVFSEKLS